MNNQLNDTEQLEIPTIEKDIEYINSDIIAKQNDGNFCKYSSILKSVAVIGLTKDQYLNYWTGRYKNRPQEAQTILEYCNKKLTERSY